MSVFNLQHQDCASRDIRGGVQAELQYGCPGEESSSHVRNLPGGLDSKAARVLEEGRVKLRQYSPVSVLSDMWLLGANWASNQTAEAGLGSPWQEIGQRGYNVSLKTDHSRSLTMRIQTDSSHIFYESDEESVGNHSSPMERVDILLRPWIRNRSQSCLVVQTPKA